MATNRRRLVELGLPPELAKEVEKATAAASVAGIAAVGTADASDLATAVALSNALKARLNALIAALKA